MTFIIAEDEALRDLLKGVVVSDEKDPERSVGVWFGMPDPEVRQQSFPFFTINLIDIAEANERVMNAEGVSPWYYEPTSLTGEDEVEYDDWSMPYPTPIDLTYQITSLARQPRHDRQILGQVLGSRLPFRFGSLVVRERLVDEETSTWDATTRRLDMIDVAKRDTVEAGKRLFMNMFTVRISSEIPSVYVWRLFKRVETVNAGIGVYDPLRPTSESPSFKETFTIQAPLVTP